MERLIPNEPVAADFEFQNYRGVDGKNRARLGWVGVVDTRGDIILECHVHYPNQIGVHTFVPPKNLGFGVSFRDLKFCNGAVPGDIVEHWLTEIFEGRKVILHGGDGDRKAWFYRDPFSKATQIIDTQHIFGRHKLAKVTATQFPNAAPIQVNGHTPVEDATATMNLYLHAATMNLYLHATPYDRSAEKAKLLAKGAAVVCTASKDQLRQVEFVKELHRQASEQVENYARSQATRGRGRGSGPSRGEPGRGGRGSRGSTMA